MSKLLISNIGTKLHPVLKVVTSSGEVIEVATGGVANALRSAMLKLKLRSISDRDNDTDNLKIVLDGLSQQQSSIQKKMRKAIEKGDTDLWHELKRVSGIIAESAKEYQSMLDEARESTKEDREFMFAKEIVLSA